MRDGGIYKHVGSIDDMDVTAKRIRADGRSVSLWNEPPPIVYLNSEELIERLKDIHMVFSRE